MAENPALRDLVSALEGTEKLLYTDPGNPYESIYIRAKIEGGALTVVDSECEHGPDGGWSYRFLVFDAENTEKVFAFLLEAGPDPLRALADMLSYTERTGLFQKACEARGIRFQNLLKF